ncbi:TonB-dependent siderophore receptor [Solitalea longa]|uniref:TonB-dependent siderophore receptor n=1 Tax=Solitalea longa TaxID=2079460 RepID=A0A2S4ZY82_9SPHI|nr:TonB-dependent receptor [Solitalea longa]POY35275.1 TonB-dependent siderophore receptor [Solitalea longa]
MKSSILKLLFILFALASPLSIFAQSNFGAVKGVVKTSDGKPAEFVSVAIKGSTKGSTTNEKGQFEIKRLQAGDYTIIVSSLGTESQERSISIKLGVVSTQDFVLKENANALSEVVVTGNKNKYKVNNPSSSLRVETPLAELPQNVQVVTSKVIKDQQIFDMLEGVTRNVSGAIKLEHWDNYALINMRGSQIAAFRNGMNVQMPWGPLTEDMSMVENIEFVKGPAGFMMSLGEPSGFYNVVTKKPTGVNKGEVAFTLGSFNTYRATVDLDGKLTKRGKLQYRLNVMGQQKESFRKFDYNDRYTVAPVLKYEFNDNTSITAEYTYQYSKMAMIGAAYVFSPNGYGDLPRNFTTAEKNLAPSSINDHSSFLTLNHKFSSNWKFTTQLAYFDFSQEGSSMWPSNLLENGDLSRGVSIWDAKGTNTLGQVFVNGDVKTANIIHRIIGGVDLGRKHYLADWSQGFALDGSQTFNIYNPVYGTVPELPAFDRSKPLKDRAGDDELQKYLGLYAQDEVSLFDNAVRVTVAGRYTFVRQDLVDWRGENSTNDGKFTPRIGVSGSINKTTTLYGLYDQAFVPQVGKLTEGGAVTPYTGDNIEFGVKKDWFGGRWNTTAAIYRITKNGVGQADPQSADPNNPTYIQLGETQAKGIELDIKGELARGLNLVFNYAYTNNKITEDTNPALKGELIPGYAKHLTNGWLSYRFNNGLLKGFGASAGYQWQIDRSTWNWGAVDTKGLPDYFRLDGALSWQNSKFKVDLNVNNLLNTYLYTGSAYDVNYDGKTEYSWQSEPGTNFRLGVAYKF